MKQYRKKHSPAFKAKVALAALQGEETVASWPAGLKFIPRIHAWKKALIQGAPEVFGRKGGEGPGSADCPSLPADWATQGGAGFFVAQVRAMSRRRLAMVNRGHR